jgi:myosin heavy subunit
MSQEPINQPGNNPGQQPQQPASTYRPQGTGNANNAPKRSNTWIFLVIIAALLGACVYLFVSRSNETSQREIVTVERDSAVNTRDALNTEYQAAIARLDQLNTTNDQLSNEIKDKDGELQKLRGDLKNIMSKDKKTVADYQKARELIAKLNQRVSSYESRIAELEGQNQELTTQNTALNEENQRVSGENTGLSQKVKLGAVLHASNLRMEAINLKRGGRKEVETSKAKRTDLLRVKFDIDENRIAEDGSKEIFMKITAPDGRLLSNAAYGSGVTTMDDGQQLSYTLSKQVNLTTNTPVRDVIVDWNQDSDYQRGTYAIELYNGGFRIGGGSVVLR